MRVRRVWVVVAAVAVLAGAMPASSQAVDVHMNYERTEAQDLWNAAAYLGATPDWVQRFGVQAAWFVTNLANRPPENLGWIQVGGPYAVRSRFTGESLEALQGLRLHYGLRHDQAVKLGTVFMVYMAGIDARHKGVSWPSVKLPSLEPPTTTIRPVSRPPATSPPKTTTTRPTTTTPRFPEGQVVPLCEIDIDREEWFQNGEYAYYDMYFQQVPVGCNQHTMAGYHCKWPTVIWEYSGSDAGHYWHCGYLASNGPPRPKPPPRPADCSVLERFVQRPSWRYPTPGSAQYTDWMFAGCPIPACNWNEAQNDVVQSSGVLPGDGRAIWVYEYHCVPW